MDTWFDGWMEGCRSEDGLFLLSVQSCACLCLDHRYMNEWIDSQTVIHTDGQINK